ncbi:hypothetical protein BGZ83_010955 [Gryganskiella cystojenkinii]|nr:hypothetical protein BGZ83_010955 [Gryganskiella cystojenkinii]
MTQVTQVTQGKYVDRVSTTDPAWSKYSGNFNGRLAALYKIKYDLPEDIKDNLEDSPQSKTYFHGTGHCGCLNNRTGLEGDSASRVLIDNWCSGRISLESQDQEYFCATRGILTRGHLSSFSPHGYFFSTNVEIAKQYAIPHAPEKDEEDDVLAIFVCKARRVQHRETDIFYVTQDQGDRRISPKKTQGMHVDRVSITDPAWSKYSGYFDGRLAALYKIEYDLLEDIKVELKNSPEGKTFFHGTGHCGCLNFRTGLEGDSASRVLIKHWCSGYIDLHFRDLDGFCATRGILTWGHLSKFSPHGHFFSTNIETAKQYAIRRMRHEEDVLAFFVCKAWCVHHRGTDIFYVTQDEYILPLYLAIVNKH